MHGPNGDGVRAAAQATAPHALLPAQHHCPDNKSLHQSCRQQQQQQHNDVPAVTRHQSNRQHDQQSGQLVQVAGRHTNRRARCRFLNTDRINSVLANRKPQTTTLIPVKYVKAAQTIRVIKEK